MFWRRIYKCAILVDTNVRPRLRPFKANFLFFNFWCSAVLFYYAHNARKIALKCAALFFCTGAVFGNLLCSNNDVQVLAAAKEVHSCSIPTAL